MNSLDRSRCAILCLAALPFLSGGCTVFSGATNDGSPGTGSAHPFAPATLRIHPLTQIDTDARAADGTPDPRPRLVVFMELKDRFGDTVKALGTFHAELIRPGEGALPAMEQPVMEWDEASFASPEANSGRFDPATRMYRIQLTGPDWLKTWKSEGKGGPAGWLKLRVVYSTTNTDGDPVVLEDVYVFQR
jgi:hypothetical protein